MEQKPRPSPLTAQSAGSQTAPSADAAGRATRAGSTAGSDPLLLIVLGVSFIAMVALPTVAALVLSVWQGIAERAHTPMDATPRAVSFFLNAYGLWGLLLFTWACVRFSTSKGLSWAYGLLALPGALSFVLIGITGSALCGLLGVIGLAGFVVPFCLEEDRLAVLGSSHESTAKRGALWFAAIGLFVGATLAYGNSFGGGMTLDNKYIIEEFYHTLLRMDPTLNVSSWKMIGYIFSNDYWWPKGISGLYRPMATYTYWINYVYGNNQLDPFQYHVVNFIMHWIAALLGFLVMRKLTGRVWVAFLAALLFVTHPIATESVSNIIGRADIAAAIAIFAGLLFYIASVEASEWSPMPWMALVLLLQFFPVTGMLAATQPPGAVLWLDVLLATTTAAVFVSIRDTDQPAELWERMVWPAIFIAVEVMVFVGTTFATNGWSPGVLNCLGALGVAIVLQLGGALAALGCRQARWIRLPWLLSLMIATLIGLFAKESAVAVLGVIVAWDVVYRWTLEDFRESLPSLVGFCGIAAIGAAAGLAIGQFGALGLSEGLIPILKIFLGLSLATGIGLAITFFVWTKGALDVQTLLKPWNRFFLAYLVILPPIVGWVCARRWVFANSSPPETPFLDNPIRGLGFIGARMTACDVFVRLLSLLAFPKTLSSDYSFNQIPLFDGHQGGFETVMCLIGVLAVLGTLVLIGLTFRRHKAVCFLLLFYLIVYLPTSNWLLIIGSIMAERFLYLPLLGFVGVVAIGVDALVRRLLDRRRAAETSAAAGFFSPSAIAACSLLVVLSLVYAGRAARRNRDWMSDITLWTAAAEASPVSFRSYQSKAFALFEQYTSRLQNGTYKTSPQMQQDDIDEIFHTAEHAKPIVDVLPNRQNSSRLYLHLGMYYSTKGESLCVHQPDGSMFTTPEAAVWFRKAEAALQQGVAVDRTFNGVNREKEHQRKIHADSEIPDVGLPPIYFYLGNVYAHLGEWDKALQAFIYMRHLDPSDAESYTRVATIYLATQKQEEAVTTLLEAIMLNPNMQQLWPVIEQTFAQINHSGVPALSMTPDKKVQFNSQVPIVRSVICSAYQGLVRTFILARRAQIARQFAATATAPRERGGWDFPPGLFDEMFTSINPSLESPTPPQSDTPVDKPAETAIDLVEQH